MSFMLLTLHQSVTIFIYLCPTTNHRVPEAASDTEYITMQDKKIKTVKEKPKAKQNINILKNCTDIPNTKALKLRKRQQQQMIKIKASQPSKQGKQYTYQD